MSNAIIDLFEYFYNNIYIPLLNGFQTYEILGVGEFNLGQLLATLISILSLTLVIGLPIYIILKLVRRFL